MTFRRNRTIVVAGLIPLLIALAALALPVSGLAAEPGAIEGTVTGEGHGGLGGVEVCAEPAVEGGEEGFSCGKSDSSGAYELAGLKAGEYKVYFEPPKTVNFVWQYYGGGRFWETATPVTVVEGATKSGVDVELEEGATMSGVVTAAATGLPVAEILVCAFKTNEFVYGCDETNGSGGYTIVGLAGGQYEVEFIPYTGQQLVGAIHSGLVTVQSRGATTGVSQALVATGQITGTVRLAATGAPLAGVRVCVTEAEFLEPLGCLTTGASGAYRFTGFWGGNVKVVFSAGAGEFPDPHPVADPYPTQWWNGASTFATATSIPITPPAIVSGIDASLGTPAAPVVAAPVAPVPPVKKSVSKPLKCRKGTVKRKVRGKPRCVRRHKASKHQRHHKKSA